MCGIVGWAGPAAEQPPTGRWASALRQIVHRGPDGGGSVARDFNQAGIAQALLLGHRRLAILDVSGAAAQPMVSPVSGIVLVFNGQIYNFRNLRAELPDFPYRGHGDTEVLLAALDRWGFDAVPRLRGMYAFAWWDPRTRELGLARDRMGVKPLYTAQPAPGLLAFASETRAVRALLPRPTELDDEGIKSFLSWGSVAEPNTIWSGIKALPPGAVARFSEGQLRQWSYWNPRSFLGQGGRDPGEVRSAVAEAVRMRLVSDVPLGVFLSSGVDSAIMAYEASRNVSSVKTLTLAFAGDDSDESSGAGATARALGLDHQVVEYPVEQIPSLFSAYVASQDQPSVDGLNTWLISRAARDAGFKVMLSGLGGDELFFGYRSFRRTRFGLLQRHRLLGQFLRALPESPDGYRDRLEGIWNARSFLHGAPWIRAFWGPRYLTRIGMLPTLPEPPYMNGTAPEDQLSLFELRHYLLNTLLRDSDVMSMNHGLELRVPFMDHPLVELALSLPAPEKWGPNTQPKHLLREQYASSLPRSVFEQPKRGFVLPFDRWLGGELREPLEEAYRGLDRSGLIPTEHVRRVKTLRGAGRLHFTRALQLLILNHWKDKQRSTLE